ARGAAFAGGDRPAGRAALFGADAVQHAAVAGGGDEPGGLRGGRALAGRGFAADRLQASPFRRGGARAGGRVSRGGAAAVVQPRLHEGAGARGQAGTERPAHGRRTRLQLQLRGGAARGRAVARDSTRTAVLALGGAQAAGTDVAPDLERAGARLKPSPSRGGRKARLANPGTSSG